MKVGFWLGSVALVTAAAMGAPAGATLVSDFELNGSTADSVGSATLTNRGGTLGATGIAFGQNQGPSVSGLSVSSVYTLDMSFSLSDVGPGARYRKLFDFKSVPTDNGLYSLYGALVFYNRDFSTPVVFAPDTMAEVTLSRDALGIVRGYVNGTEYVNFDDSLQGDAIIDSVLTLLTDENNGGESAPGFVDYLRVYDQALTPAQLAAQTPGSPVPEPASWAMMVAGFGLLGSALRRRRVNIAFA